jgi:hypothetical protein
MAHRIARWLRDEEANNGRFTRFTGLLLRVQCFAIRSGAFESTCLSPRACLRCPCCVGFDPAFSHQLELDHGVMTVYHELDPS